MRPAGEQLVGDRVETVQCFVHHTQIGLAGAGQRQAAMVPDKQRRVQIGLQLAHLLTDRGLRDIELLRRQGEAQPTAGRLEGPQDV